MSSHIILISIIYLVCSINGQAVKVQASNVLESLMPATSNYVWEILDKGSPDYELELKNLYHSMKAESKKLEYWEFLEQKNSKTYRCAIEETIPGVSNPEGREKEETQSPKELLSRLSEVCLYKFEGWWSYEFCYGKHIRQFHVEPISQTEHKVTVEYYLGFAPKGLAEDEAQQEENSYAYKENYVGGTPCDLNVEKRSAVVNFVCDPKNDNHILSILEPSSCVYEVNINTPYLCQHPKYFKENIAEKSNKIFCFEKPLTSEEEIEKKSEVINRYSKEKDFKKKTEELVAQKGGKVKGTVPIQIKEEFTVVEVTELGPKVTTTTTTTQKQKPRAISKEEKEKIELEIQDQRNKELDARIKQLEEKKRLLEKRSRQNDAYEAVSRQEDKRKSLEREKELHRVLKQAEEAKDANHAQQIWAKYHDGIKASIEEDLSEAWEKFKKDDSTYHAFQAILDDPKTSEALKSALTQLIHDLKNAKFQNVELDDTADENGYSTSKIQLEEPEDLEFY